MHPCLEPFAFGVDQYGYWKALQLLSTVGKRVERRSETTLKVVREFVPEAVKEEFPKFAEAAKGFPFIEINHEEVLAHIYAVLSKRGLAEWLVAQVPRRLKSALRVKVSRLAKTKQKQEQQQTNEKEEA